MNRKMIILEIPIYHFNQDSFTILHNSKTIEIEAWYNFHLQPS